MRLRRDKGGFSLVELMIAIGILGVGMIMIATAFPAAIMENKESADDTMSTILAENALALIRTNLTHGQVNLVATANWTRVDNNTTLFNEIDTTYNPFGVESRLAWVAWARHDVGVNDYLFLIMPYRKFQTGDEVLSAPTPVFLGDGRLNMATTNGTNVMLQNTGNTPQAYTEPAQIGWFMTRTSLRP